MNIVFFGSSSFSIPVLERLIHSKHSVIQIVTTPDQKKGRGQKVQPSLIKTFAEAKSIPVLAPKKLKEPEIVKAIQSLVPDILVAASYGKLIPPSIFKLPKVAALNVHPSLLPRHRGASPIQQALLEGDAKTGVSIAEITAELDSGDIFAQVTVEIQPHENAQELSDRLAVLASNLIVSVVDQFSWNKVTRSPQDNSKATYAKKIDKDFGRIHWNQPANKIHNQIRACVPWPSAFTFLAGKRLKVLEAELLRQIQTAPPGKISGIRHEGIEVQTQSGTLLIKRVQLEGRNEMSAYDFAMGQRLKTGGVFES